MLLVTSSLLRLVWPTAFLAQQEKPRCSILSLSPHALLRQSGTRSVKLSYELTCQSGVIATLSTRALNNTIECCTACVGRGEKKESNATMYVYIYEREVIEQRGIKGNKK
jgi:hypothetical protein